MKRPARVELRIGRVVADSGALGGLDGPALGQAVQQALAARLQPAGTAQPTAAGAAASLPQRVVTTLAGHPALGNMLAGSTVGGCGHV